MSDWRTRLGNNLVGCRLSFMTGAHTVLAKISSINVKADTLTIHIVDVVVTAHLNCSSPFQGKNGYLEFKMGEGEYELRDGSALVLSNSALRRLALIRGSHHTGVAWAP